jgi:MYXO-CTERM domain-containing protein
VSLMKAAYPHLTPLDARHILQKSADPSALCADPDDATLAGCGAGLLDVDAAIVLAEQAQANGGFDARLGNVVSSSCSFGGGASGERGGMLVMMALLAVAAVCRRRVL